MDIHSHSFCRIDYIKLVLFVKAIMAIPKEIHIKNNSLPDEPGIYFMKDKTGVVVYIGKATSLKKRVTSYFTKAHDKRIAEMVSKISAIDYIETPTVIEALVLEANQIRKFQPYYNVRQRDDKSFLYLGITNEDFPRPLFYRGLELERMEIDPFKLELSTKAKKKFIALFGPYTSGHSLRVALDLVRKIIPWSVCQPGEKRPCFYHQIKKCPGVCVGSISKSDYRKIIKNLILFFEGRKGKLIRDLEKQMKKLSTEHEFEEAAILRNKIFSLNHIQDVSLITGDDELPYTKEPGGMIDLEGRIEGYDISLISGTAAVGSMVVFKEGKPSKKDYRKFRIKTIEGTNDVAMMQEVIERRLRRAANFPNAWPLPELMVIDGGLGQVNIVREVLDDKGVDIPIVGIAKGYMRKQDRLVFDKGSDELRRLAEVAKPLFQRVRDEAHRFAIKYHKQVRGKKFIPNK